MKMWRLCFLLLICSGLCVAFGLSGCGDNPCENGEPDTCGNIANTIDHSCLVIEQDDFACLCLTDETGEYSWNENAKTCDLVED